MELTLMMLPPRPRGDHAPARLGVAQEAAAQGDVKHPLPVLVRQFLRAETSAGADIADQDVDASESAIDLGEERRDLLTARVVAGDGQAAPAESLDFATRDDAAVGIDVADHHVGAGAGQAHRHGVARAAVGTAARDECDLAAEIKQAQAHSHFHIPVPRASPAGICSSVMLLTPVIPCYTLMW
jgi:hypothetical protein